MHYSKLLFTLSILLSFFAGQSSYAQVCIIEVLPEDTTICPGQQVQVVANANLLNSGQYFDFNSGTLPGGWTVSGGSNFSSPCEPSLDNSPYYWASTSGTTPAITTTSFDVTCGGVITFDMDFAIQGGAVPCEGMEVWNEGVELQYSTDGGITWLPIVYYAPDGMSWPSMTYMQTSGSWLGVQAPWSTSTYVPTGATNAFTSWASYEVPIPAAALSTNTMFRWFQANSSSSTNDNWGIDNVVINSSGTPCGENVVVNWDNGFMDTTSFTVSPITDTAFVAYVYDTLGNLQCTSDSIFINIHLDNMTIDLIDTFQTYCAFDTIPIEVFPIDALEPITYSWSNGDTTPDSYIGANASLQDDIWEYVTVTDACGYTEEDSVLMIVNQTLSIDTIIHQNSAVCVPTGWANAQVSGTNETQSQPIYQWTGPGNPGPINIDGTTTPDVPSGWYYFTVIDDVCEATDSVFIDQDPPPSAAFTPASSYGCNPLTVNFVNESENAVSFEWYFGDGSDVATTENATHQFAVSSNVMLIASDGAGCPDTAYAVVDVVPCGCMNELALNYDPLAQIDDGSCVYPEPVVVAPNIFTPDGDNVNDLFELDAMYTQEITLVITNRWGNIMYRGVGINPAWDGINDSGQKAEAGVYFYRYTAIGIIPEDIIEGHGFFHLERK